MSTNNFLPHIVFLPEDRAQNSVLNGFLGHSSFINNKQISPLPLYGGRLEIDEKFEKNYLNDLKKFKDRHLVLLFDFDKKGVDKFKLVKEQLAQQDEDIRNRVYLLGPMDEPEDLRRATSLSLEKIGKKLAAECFENKLELWEHEHLKHNTSERRRLNVAVRSILF